MRVCTLIGLVASFLLAGAPAHADSIRTKQWQLRALGASDAWRYATGDGVTVAVLDSGVDASHPDLVGQVLPGADFVDGSTDGRKDFVGHGTTVAALIAGRDDDSGVVGIAPHAKILPVRVLDAENRYRDASTVAQGLRWAVDHGADVVNLSLGGANRSQVLADAIGYARAHDVVVVACTGNLAADGARQIWYPAREAGVVAVAGLGASAATLPAREEAATGAANADLLWPESLTGPQTVLTAPAADLVGARPGGYWRVQGTSFAAPLVTATATLVRSRWPRLNADNVINRLVRTARDLGPVGRDDRYGFGEVKPADALTAEVATTGRDPLELAGPKSATAQGASANPTGKGGPEERAEGSGGPSGTVTRDGDPGGSLDAPPTDATPQAAANSLVDSTGRVAFVLAVVALLAVAAAGYIWRRRDTADPIAAGHPPGTVHTGRPDGDLSVIHPTGAAARLPGEARFDLGGGSDFGSLLNPATGSDHGAALNFGTVTEQGGVTEISVTEHDGVTEISTLPGFSAVLDTGKITEIRPGAGRGAESAAGHVRSPGSDADQLVVIEPTAANRFGVPRTSIATDPGGPGSLAGGPGTATGGPGSLAGGPGTATGGPSTAPGVPSTAAGVPGTAPGGHTGDPAAEPMTTIVPTGTGVVRPPDGPAIGRYPVSRPTGTATSPAPVEHPTDGPSVGGSVTGDGSPGQDPIGSP